MRSLRMMDTEFRPLLRQARWRTLRVLVDSNDPGRCPDRRPCPGGADASADARRPPLSLGFCGPGGHQPGAVNAWHRGSFGQMHHGVATRDQFSLSDDRPPIGTGSCGGRGNSRADRWPRPMRASLHPPCPWGPAGHPPWDRFHRDRDPSDQPLGAVVSGEPLLSPLRGGRGGSGRGCEW